MTHVAPQDIPARLAAELAIAPAGPIGLAVSGGGDSMALLALAEEWADLAGRALAVATVDHGLRADSAAEAQAVAARCQTLGIAHDTLQWLGWDGRGNLPQAARAARRLLIAGWAKRRGIGAVALAHTAEDQAETFLMRLARGSGVAGLAAMTAVSAAEGILWLRPLLSARREDLRAILRRRGWGWVDDPTNEDAAYDRVKARALLDSLAPLGLTVERLALTARHMADAREVLDEAEAALARAALRMTPLGEAKIDRETLIKAPAASRLQLLADLLSLVGGAVYPPRLDALERLFARLMEGDGGTSLHGCVIRAQGPAVRIRREPSRVAPPIVALDGAHWDRRWRLSGPGNPAHRIAALGRAGLLALPQRPQGSLEALASTPAVWDGAQIVAAPLAGLSEGWSAIWAPHDARRRRLFNDL